MDATLIPWCTPHINPLPGPLILQSEMLFSSRPVISPELQFFCVCCQMYASRHVCCATQDNLLREQNRTFYPLEYKYVYKKRVLLFSFVLPNIVLKSLGSPCQKVNAQYNLQSPLFPTTENLFSRLYI
jgi:hypothetical protein